MGCSSSIGKSNESSKPQVYSRVIKAESNNNISNGINKQQSRSSGLGNDSKLPIERRKTQNEISFVKIVEGMSLLYLDSYQVNGSNDHISIWREAVVEVYDRKQNIIKIRLISGKFERQQITIDVVLNVEWHLIALFQLNLSKKQRMNGIELDEEQLR